ncbi:hypothetical protein [Streptococcus oricebi]|uniref:Lipoprotein n=1 Tax=Streptococcus oricebi TaxID=1547447 RepID=A0ABS5B1U4_9STRE|nr:hypothetical protein [Streptococcus oricebi]MBP2622777.1 hypothetical protein [Streptococcus oricebi]
MMKKRLLSFSLLGLSLALLVLLGACSAQQEVDIKRSEKQAQLEEDLEPVFALFTDKKIKDKAYVAVTEQATTDIKDSKSLKQLSNYQLDLKLTDNGYVGKINLVDHSSYVWYQKGSLYKDEKYSQKLEDYQPLFDRLNLTRNYLGQLDVKNSAKKPDADILEISYLEDKQSENLKQIRKDYGLSDSATATITLKRKYNAAKRYAYSLKYSVKDSEKDQKVEYQFSFELSSPYKAKKKK